MLRRIASLGCALVLSGGCMGTAPEPTPNDVPTPSAGSTSASAATQTPLATDAVPAPVPTADLSTRPVIWFTPHAEVRLPDFNKGSSDYFDLFAPGSPWTTAANHTQVFKFYDNLGFGREPTDDEIRLVVSALRERGLAFAMELGPLPHPLAGGSNTECGDGVEGFSGPFAIANVQRITDIGARIDLVAFDEPFAHATLFDGPSACLWSNERTATEVAEFVRSLREINPDVIVGDIEPAWNGPLVGAAEIGAWLDAYEAELGEPMGFFHLDVDWTREGWQTIAREIEDAVRSRGVPFGIIYNGGEGAESDAEWLHLTAERAYDYEQIHGGQPDHVNFQSWHFYPRRVLPDSDPNTFTGMINRYFGERTSMTVRQVDGSAGTASVSGSLSTLGGAAVDGAPITGLAEPLEGGTDFLRLEGSVPDGAREALVAVRINTEGAGPGVADMNIYEVVLSFGGGPNVLANPRFNQQLNGWFPDGPGTATAPRSDRGNGRMLRLRADEGETLVINTPNFAVPAGSPYEFIVDASIPAESADSGYITVIFLGSDELEIQRDILPLAPVPLEVTATTTDGSGAFTLSLPGLAAGRYILRADYDGDLEHWPSWVEQEIEIGG
jgi:hypothetical protein